MFNRLFWRPHHAAAAQRQPIETLASTGMAAGAVVLFWRVSHGNTLRYTFVPAMGLAYLCHMASTAKQAPDPQEVLPLYQVALASQFLHFTEEFATGFERRWPEEIFHTEAYDLNTFVAINMVSYAVFTLAGLAMAKRVRPPLLLAWFFTLMGVLGNAIQYPIYALIVRGYFPGLYSSLLYWALGPMLVRRLWAARAQSACAA